MNCCVLTGSPRPQGNTAALTAPVLRVLEGGGVRCRTIRLHGRDIRPCTACRVCQRDWSGFCCVQKDDMGEIAEQVLESELLLLATPIYSWYCTPPMKAALDRLVYGLNKYYGGEKGPSLWAGKRVALVTTCGYRPEKGADLWEEGVRRYCRHSNLTYLGMLAGRHLGYDTVFLTPELELQAEAFGRMLLERCDPSRAERGGA